MKWQRVIGTLAALAIASWILWGFWQAYRPQPILLQGQIEAREYNVGSKVPGRVATVAVRRGDLVEAGQPVFSINSPELEARLEQARGARQSASALEQAADSGAREQEKNAAFDVWQTAKAAEDLAEKTYQRLQNLFDDGVVSRQRRDEAWAAYQAAQFTASAAWETYSLADEGARQETREAAAGQTRAASGLVAEAEALQDDLVARSPVAGEVSNVFLQVGELAPQGFPVVTVLDIQEAWAVFQVREDFLSRFAKDSQHQVRIPALGEDAWPFEVAYVSPMGEFATWRATSAGQGYDLKTFEVEIRPLRPIPGLRVGMTALIQIE